MKLFKCSVLVSCAALIGACSTAESANESLTTSDNGCVGLNCQTGSAAKDDYDLVVETGIGGGSSSADSTGNFAISRCGLSAIGCNPDDETSCDHAVISVDAGSGGASTSGTNVGSAAGTTALGGASSNSVGKVVDVDGKLLACHILFDNAVPLSQCELTGSGLTGEPCVSRADCAPGYTCADDNGTTQCRHYCCGGDDVCPTGTYCDEREVREAEAQAITTFAVPVCMPKANCRFDDPYPCPAGQTCSCPAGRVCGVVRADGTTACVVPGTGLEGDFCPCAAGHVCSDVLGTCVKTCSMSNVAANAEQCSLGVCQSSTSLPVDVGICVSSVTLY